jgi:hypothetical protein
MSDAHETRASLADILEYPFGTPGDHNEYRIFPDELEHDPEVFFHGTERRVLKAMVDEGFKLPPSERAQSASFSKTSGLALGYAAGRGADGVVIAVRFGANNKSLRAHEPFGLHAYSFDPQPEIVAYCIVPATYAHR